MRYVLAASLLAATQAQAEAPKVVADIGPIKAIVDAVLGDVGVADLVIEPGTDPHGASLRPSTARALSQADLVVWVGETMTPGLSRGIALGSETRVTIEMEDLPGILKLPAREGGGFGDGHHHDHGDEHGHEEHAGDEHDHDEHGHEEHAGDEHDHDEHGHEEHADKHGHDEHGHEEHAGKDDHDEHDHEEHAGHDHDEHGHDDHSDEAGLDPHLWLSPTNAVVLSVAVADALSEIAPDHAAEFEANAAAFAADMDAVFAETQALLADYADQPFLVGHDAYQYFEAEYDLAAIGAVSATDATDPSVADMSELKAAMGEGDISCVVTDLLLNEGLIEAIAPEATVVQIDPLGRDAPDFVSHMKTMGAGFAACLSGSAS